MPQIVVYSSPTCVKCMMVKDVLNTRKIPFEVRDITQTQFKKELVDLNIMSIPTVMKIDDFGDRSYVIGFDLVKLEELIKDMQEDTTC